MAISGVGTQFRVWDPTASSVGAWVKIGEVYSINGPGKTVDSIETTSLDTTGGYKTYIKGFRDGGEVSLSIGFTRANYDRFNADYESSSNSNYEIVLPDDDNTSLELEGFVTNLPLTIVPDDKITMDVTIKVSGKPVVNSGSGS